MGALAEAINKNSDLLGGIRASYLVQSTGSSEIKAGTVKGLNINGIDIGDVIVDQADRDGNLVNAINKYTTETGVTASIENGRLNLTSADGRGILVDASNAASASSVLGLTIAAGTGPADNYQNYGRITLTSLGANDIVVRVYSGTGADGTFNNAINTGASTQTYNLRGVRGIFTTDQIDAAGGFANAAKFSAAGGTGKAFGAGVTTREGAMLVMDIAESAIGLLDRIRSDIGSAQQQLEVTLNNISVTQVNVKAAESGIRDVDFGSESSNFSKQSILIQSGSYALSQANAVQQNVLRLLQ
jgi:flagellin